MICPNFQSCTRRSLFSAEDSLRIARLRRAFRRPLLPTQQAELRQEVQEEEGEYAVLSPISENEYDEVHDVIFRQTQRSKDREISMMLDELEAVLYRRDHQCFHLPSPSPPPTPSLFQRIKRWATRCFPRWQ